MANEYLKRTPTSTGNRRVWTWSGWIKRASNFSVGEERIWTAGNGGGGGLDPRTDVGFGAGNFKFDINSSGNSWNAVTTTPIHRDPSSWSHIMFVIDTTQTSLNEQRKIFFNGVRELLTSGSALSSNELTPYNLSGHLHVIGSYVNNLTENLFKGEMSDVFFIDGQALTPDVFGFYKQGKGYISAGSTQATDFRPGQWVPKTPRVIKTEINRRGGFGVNGFYLPMNDSNNFGADFHCTPNSIIKLQENLPQPKCRIDGVGNYTGALRDDPFKQYLVLALPFVSGGLSSGFGDYSAAIKGSGTAKTIGSTSATITNVSAGSTSGLYYGSGASFSNSGIGVSFASSSDFGFGTGDYTVECWIHRSNASSSSGSNALWTIGNVNNVGSLTLFYENTAFVLRSRGTGDASYTNDFSLTSSNFSTQQWNHFAVCRKGTTVTLYANGVAAGISTTSTRNVDTNPFIVGSITASGLYPFFGFMQDLRIYKGVAKYTGGFDVSRPYTPVGIATFRAVPDTTANNFATLQPTSGVYKPNVTFSSGNLTISKAVASTNEGVFGSVGVSTGRWYWEMRLNSFGSASDYVIVGIAKTEDAPSLYGARSFQSLTYTIVPTGGFNPINGGTSISYGNVFVAGDILGVGLDLSNYQLTFYRNGISQGIAASGASNFGATSGSIDFWRPYQFGDNSNNSYNLTWNFGQNPTFSGNTTAGTYTDSNGKGLFKYEPPSGFLALCEDNLPTPAISDPGKHFKTVLYTGDGNNGRSIVGVGFTPDLVWGKSRTNTAFPFIVDSIRGPGNRLFTNDTQGDNFSASSITSFDSDGFSMGSLATNNASSQNYVAWCWRAGAGTTSTNTNGSITSVVSVNQDAGFSIVSWTGNGSASATIGHGLGKTPSFIITKGRESVGDNGWLVQHKSVNNYDSYMYLNATSAAGAFGTSGWTPSNTTITLKTNFTDNNKKYIAYCWAEIEGFSKFGSYVGNGSADGPFVFTNHRPAWVLIKRTDINGENWLIYDCSRNSVNPTSSKLVANSSVIEDDATIGNNTENTLDLLSNGFKLRTTNTGTNASGGSYIFAAYAESPFKTANAK